MGFSKDKAKSMAKPRQRQGSRHTVPRGPLHRTGMISPQEAKPKSRSLEELTPFNDPPTKGVASQSSGCALKTVSFFASARLHFALRGDEFGLCGLASRRLKDLKMGSHAGSSAWNNTHSALAKKLTLVVFRRGRLFAATASGMASWPRAPAQSTSKFLHLAKLAAGWLAIATGDTILCNAFVGNSSLARESLVDVGDACGGMPVQLSSSLAATLLLSSAAADFDAACKSAEVTGSWKIVDCEHERTVGRATACLHRHEDHQLQLPALPRE